MFVSVVAELTGWPLIEVITSPELIPAAAAGPVGITCRTMAPAPPAASLTPTPRNAVGPMCTVGDEAPERICPAMAIASLIGIAKPWPRPRWKFCDAAVFIPITWLAALTVGP